MIKHLNDARTVAFVGISKNAGKTTTLNKVIEQTKKTIGLTSIGLDGEALDQITHLPKPKITVLEGMIVATASECLKTSTAEYEVLHTFADMPSSLGLITLVKIKTKGTLIVAGPVALKQLNKLLETMKKMTDITLVDGALARKTFASLKIIDSIILCSGAAFHPMMEETIKETHALVRALSLKPYTNKPFNKASLVGIAGDKVMCRSDKLDATITALIKTHPLDVLYIDKAITERMVEVLIKEAKALKNTTLVVEDATKLLMRGGYFKYLEILFKEIYVFKALHVAFVTVNPFSPTTLGYDKNAFINGMKKDLTVPVYNVNDLE